MRARYFTPEWDDWRRASSRQPRLTARERPTPHSHHDAREPARTRRGRDPRQRAAASGAGDASRIASSFEWLGFQPASFMRSFATTHGYARYGHDRRRRVAEAAAPEHLQHALGGLVRQRRADRRRGCSASASSAASQPSDGDVVHARERLFDGAEQRGRDVVDVHDLHRRAPVPRNGDRRPAGRRAAEQRVAPAPTTGATRRRVAMRPSAPIAHSDSTRSHSASRIAGRYPGFGRSTASSVSGTGLFSHAPYTAALESRTTRRTPARAAASSTRRVPSQFTRVINASSGIGPTIAARCTMTSTFVRSAFRMSTRWNVSLRARRGIADVESDDARDLRRRVEQRQQPLSDEAGDAGDRDGALNHGR